MVSFRAPQINLYAQDLPRVAAFYAGRGFDAGSVRGMTPPSAQTKLGHMDTLKPADRRRNMAAIRGKDTRPEWVVRRLLHRMGYRYRLHYKGLPGRPDIACISRKKVVEVRGCFWHRHPGCPAAATPATRPEFWRAKFAATIARDARNLVSLETAGWKALVIWECEVNSPSLTRRLRDFLGQPRRDTE
jgi:DNA mismatch endonuclease, patch repair protein